MSDSLVVPVDKSECCGCGACVKKCKFEAIKMVRDEEGFEYPVVDESKCQKCGMCVKQCSFYNSKKDEKEKSDVYIAKYNNDDIRMNSRSGAIFVAISDEILNDNGVVYGCVLTNNNKILHIRANNKDDRNLMCKSKYAQSSTKGIFDDILKDLQNGKKVLFTGVGCQVDAVINFVNSHKEVDISNLFTIDIVCHGVVSPLIFEEYINWLERKYKSKVEKFNFRDKNIAGWEPHVESFVVNNKRKFSTIYRNLFYSSLCIRPSCYNCKYTKIKRKSDITIADAWGIKQVCPELYDNKGASTVIVQSEKGNALIERIKKVCTLKKVSIEDVYQPNLERPTKYNNNRDNFWEDYKKYGFNKIVRKYGSVGIKRAIKEKIKYTFFKFKK